MTEEVSTTHLVGSGMRYWFVLANVDATTPAVLVGSSELHIGLVAVAPVQLCAAAVVIVELNYPHI